MRGWFVQIETGNRSSLGYGELYDVPNIVRVFEAVAGTLKKCDET